MKTRHVFAAGLVHSLAATAVLMAAAAPGPKARLFAQYDTNHNGLIDGDEIAALRKAFGAEPKGDLARFDTNHDGKLSDEEIAALRPPGQGGAKSEKKKSGKKNDAETKAAAPTNP